MKRILLCALLAILAAPAYADDLLEITLRNPGDALLVQQTGAAVACVERNVYLVLTDPSTREQFQSHGFDIREILPAVDRARLAVDRRPVSMARTDRTVVYERNGLRIVSIDRNLSAATDSDFLPLGLHPLVVRYLPPRPPLAASLELPPDLDSLIARVSEDSLRAYTERLEAFYRRVVGTDSNYAARDWIDAKFRSFGYDSVVVDPCVGNYYNWGELVYGFNVVACKPGTTNPDKQIIIGGHFDAVGNCPGADDNASGTAGTIEIARVLAAADLPMTLKFIAFDGEESWMVGSGYYADSIAAEGADVVFMMNLDMIGHINNSDSANLYHGPEDSYARFWQQTGPAYGITKALLSGSTASDHQPFADNGWDVLFVQEGRFSTNYHSVHDSTTYLNFEYMTRMAKTSLHTALATAIAPPPVPITAVLEPGDGHSQIVVWRNIAYNTIDHLRLTWYPLSSPYNTLFVDLPPTDTSYTVAGLTENVTYAFYVQAVDTDNRSSLAVKEAYGTPRSVPFPPAGLTAMPIRHGIRLCWRRNNTELDFDRYSIIRDGAVVAAATDTVYDDLDPLLGEDLHSYLVRATDSDDNSSDTAGIVPSASRAATLDPDRVLAVNRSSTAGGLWVDEIETGAFLREALSGFDYDYRSDTAALSHPGDGIRLFDLISHGVLVVGDESGRGMDISKDPASGGILDTLAYYASIGGRLIVFGRFGNFTTGDTVDYAGGLTYDDAFTDIFHIDRRIQTRTGLQLPNLLLGDLVGALPVVDGYLALAWDSLLTAAHVSADTPPLVAPTGIPLASFVELNSGPALPLYTYESFYDTSSYNGGTVAWYYHGNDYKYTFFDIPLSFCNRAAAIATLRKAVEDIMSRPTDIDDDPDPLPARFTLAQNYPNPFNPSTTIEYSLPAAGHAKLTIYNLLGQTVTVLADGKQSSGPHRVVWNGTDRRGRSVATGIYFYRLEMEGKSLTRKMLLVK